MTYYWKFVYKGGDVNMVRYRLATYEVNNRTFYYIEKKFLFWWTRYRKRTKGGYWYYPNFALKYKADEYLSNLINNLNNE